MSLSNLIQEISGWEAKTAAELTATLNAETVPAGDDDMYTWAGVAVAIGSDAADNLRVFMEANGLGWAVHQLGGSGIQLSYPTTQTMLANLVAAGVVGADTLAWIGSHNVSPYVNDGGVGLVTEAEVSAALLELSVATNREAARVAAAQVYNDCITAIDAWNGYGSAPAIQAVP